MARAPRPSAGSALALNAGASGRVGGKALEGLKPAGHEDAGERLKAAMAELKALSAEPLVRRAVEALNRDDHLEGAKWAIKALEKDERNGPAWYALAFARERAGDFAGSLHCFESALALLPDQAQVANDLGRLAVRMGMLPQAEKLFIHFIGRHPESPDGWNNLGCVLRDQARFGEAIDVVKAALEQHPENAMLWNTLGSILSESGDPETSLVFYREALRLNPAFAKAQYNIANILLGFGQGEAALADCEGALAQVRSDTDRQMMRLARATMLLNLQRLKEGWDEYESRLDHQYDDATIFAIDRPRWTPGEPLEGKSLLVVAEQGLGDEVLFANALEDAERALGPEGALTLAVEARLVPLFKRSFPKARVGAHATHLVQARTVRHVPFLGDGPEVDLWTPAGSLLRQFRARIEDFPPRAGFLTPDPERIAHWRNTLAAAPPGRKVGLLWKSNLINVTRSRYFSAFEQWAPVLKTAGIGFVNLQYGDCSEEIEYARRELGVEIWTPPGIDLKQDLDDLAALCCAIDLMVGFSNATFNIGAACGAPSWLISTLGSWPRLGTDRYPWYPQTRVFLPAAYGDWGGVMGAVAEALARFAADGTGAAPEG